MLATSDRRHNLPSEKPLESGLLVCPYDEVHRVRVNRMPYHLQTCSLLYPGKEKYTICMFNGRHIIKESEQTKHQLECGDRFSVKVRTGSDRRLIQEGCSGADFRQNMGGGYAEVPEVDNTESIDGWDCQDDDDSIVQKNWATYQSCYPSQTADSVGGRYSSPSLGSAAGQFIPSSQMKDSSGSNTPSQSAQPSRRQFVASPQQHQAHQPLAGRGRANRGEPSYAPVAPGVGRARVLQSSSTASPPSGISSHTSSQTQPKYTGPPGIGRGRLATAAFAGEQPTGAPGHTSESIASVLSAQAPTVTSPSGARSDSPTVAGLAFSRGRSRGRGRGLDSSLPAAQTSNSSGVVLSKFPPEDGQFENKESYTSQEEKVPSTSSPAGTQPSKTSAVTAKNRIRNIQKTLNQISGLEEKKRKGAVLDPDQLAKIARRTDLEEDLRQLQLSAAEL